jgi:predicted nicotinamide N-methyase
MQVECPDEGMRRDSQARRVLDTTGGEFPLHEYRLRQAGREWTILHTGAILDILEEARVIADQSNRLPYGVALWPSGIALAHEIATRAAAFSGRTVLELGAGTGLPGIVAASLGARVVQTDRDELVLHLCRINGERNGPGSLEYRLADWTDWRDEARYEWIIGSDILYGESLHPHLRRIFESNLAPRGRILLSDPFRGIGLRLLERLEAAGWGVRYNHWDVGEGDAPLPIAVFELVPPGSGSEGGAAGRGP